MIANLSLIQYRMILGYPPKVGHFALKGIQVFNEIFAMLYRNQFCYYKGVNGSGTQQIFCDAWQWRQKELGALCGMLRGIVLRVNNMIYKICVLCYLYNKGRCVQSIF
jgi:hypothetical protein